VQSLTQSSHKLAEQMYKQTAASAAPGAGGDAGAGQAPPADAGSGAGTDGTVVDAEFEEADKDKK
jgi:molecular chaperone DnaK